MVAEERLAGGGRFDETLTGLLGLPEVDHIHVSDTQAGCYDFRVERRR